MATTGEQITMATCTEVEPVLLYVVDAAKSLGISRAMLYTLMRRHDVYKPSRIGHRTVYHRKHIEIMASVLIGAMSEDDGLAMWAAAKRQMKRGYV